MRSDELVGQVRAFLAEHAPATTERLEFLRARFDAGLAWVNFPQGLGGMDLPRDLQPVVDGELAAAGAPDVPLPRVGIGLGMAAPTMLRHGTVAQLRRWLRPLWTEEEVWCQLFSEPGAGSDLASVSTRAVREADGDWVVDGQKVWTSTAHEAQWAVLLARSDPSAPKHEGLTYFACDMSAPGVEVRPLRQITGEAEFNEVFLTGVRIPDAHRIGEVGQGWQVARTTLMNERVALGGDPVPRGDGMIGLVVRKWRARPELRTAAGRDALLRLWVAAEAGRLTAQRLREELAAGQPGPDGSAVKYANSHLNQEISGFELELLGDEALRYDDWTMRRPSRRDWRERTSGYRYLRARANSIEGGTSEILCNVIAERVLGLPREVAG
ncbi:acyl-CoA dehydrogenase [Phytohabitans flavus]|uniref:Acyl-CoA dehydrogenase n=1 Tax=Phytohabitans flavus TaxID=1076124 RepID=A0A6F8XM94_9ACTN|nr:acyl-CoA dehydrogenase family protein [Phytohabitans flavus]BCB74909.1 acyl-CoA dehydrogenase [Phytohabitans flavus]